MTLMSKLAALALSAAAMLNVHATPVVVNAQSAAHYRQAAATSTIATMSAPAQARTVASSASRAPAPSPVPEPIHYKLMLLGLGLVLLFGRRGAGRQKPWTKN